MLKKLHGLLKQPKEREGLEERLEDDKDLRKISLSTRNSLRNLATEIMKTAGKPSATKKAKPKKVAAQGKVKPKKTSVKRNGKSKRASDRE